MNHDWLRRTQQAMGEIRHSVILRFKDFFTGLVDPADGHRVSRACNKMI